MRWSRFIQAQQDASLLFQELIEECEETYANHAFHRQYHGEQNLILHKSLS
jgi:hypothetical protein